MGRQGCIWDSWLVLKTTYSSRMQKLVIKSKEKAYLKSPEERVEPS